MLLILALVLPLCVSGQSEPNETDLREVAHRMFLIADSNGDGVLHLEEMVTDFLKCDENRDGRISRHEYVVCSIGDDASLEAVANAYMDIFDFNGDHHLEMDDFTHNYQAIDTDGNDKVTEAEFIAYWIERLYELQAAGHPPIG